MMQGQKGDTNINNKNGTSYINTKQTKQICSILNRFEWNLLANVNVSVYATTGTNVLLNNLLCL